MKESSRALARIDRALAQLTTDGDSLEQLSALVDSVRPPRFFHWGKWQARAVIRWRYLNEQLNSHPQYRAALGKTVAELFSRKRQVKLYSESGLLPNSGFFSELSRKLTHKLLPMPRDSEELNECISQLFWHKRDEEWLACIPLEDRAALWHTVSVAAAGGEQAMEQVVGQMLAAAQILMYRICAMGYSPQLLHAYPRLRDSESPFVALHRELDTYLQSFVAQTVSDAPLADTCHLDVLFEQCEDVIHKAKLGQAKRGTSMDLSFLLVRLEQHLARLKLLVQVLTVKVRPDQPDELIALWTAFLTDVVMGERRHNSVGMHFSNLLSMLALRISDNAAKTGEHYIADSRRDWVKMFWLAAGAGIFIACMARLKIAAAYLGISQTGHYWVNGAIYAGGFAVIYLLHFIIATKQPAMTAAALSNYLSQSSGRVRDTEKVVDVMVMTWRSQLAAIAGNVLVALPLAIAISFYLYGEAGGHTITADKAHHLLQELEPFTSPALLYAAVAGVWLFMTGLISGYIDNRVVYNALELRLAQLPKLRAVLGARGAAWLGGYIAQNAGGLLGNIFFGLMLGLTPLFGQMLGLPLDIRHIAFASANLGYALFALDFQLPVWAMLWGFVGVMLIGTVNLCVSFGLALFVALRSRGVSPNVLRSVLPRLLARVKAKPLSFVLPPKGADINSGGHGGGQSPSKEKCAH